MSAPAGGRMRPEPQYDLLLRAALAPPEEAAPALRRWRAQEDLVDPDMGVLRLLPLLGDRAGELAPDDTELQRRVAHVSRFAWLRGQLMVRKTAPGVAALQEAGVPVLLLKGAALIQVPGVERRVRMMDDLDVLVREEHVPLALQVLPAAGFRTAFTAHANGLASLLPRLHAIAFGEQGGEIDLHWHALHTVRHPALDASWWEDAQPAQLLGVRTLAAGPSDVLVQSIAHGSRWVLNAAPRWVVDVALLMGAAGERLDWDRVVRQARATRLSAVVADALAYVEEATGLRPPPDAVAALRRAPVPVAERLRARRRRDPADGGPVLPGPAGRLGEAYESRVTEVAAPGATTGVADAARIVAQEWWLPSVRSVPAQALFTATGRPWPLRRVARRAAQAPTRAVPDDAPRYERGRVLSFEAGGDGGVFLGGGWYYPESFGTWSEGTPSHVVLPLVAPLERAFDVELQLIGFVTQYAPRLRVDLALNDVRVARLCFTDPGKPIAIVRRSVPAAVARGWNRLELTFVARHPVMPAEAREGSDLRRLAVGLVKLGVA